MPKVGVVMGSKSDLPIVQEALDCLKKIGIDYEVRVMSAHRTPEEAASFAKNARKNGIEVIIAAAGKAAHLPGVLAAYTTLPVIGLPIKSSFMDGLDSLLSMVQMPNGVPVATVAVGGAENAAILAAQILGIKYAEVEAQLQAMKETMASNVRVADDAVQKETK